MRKTPKMAGLEIKNRRKACMLTQADLADELFTSERHIRNLEKGECSLGLYLAALDFLKVGDNVTGN